MIFPCATHRAPLLAQNFAKQMQTEHSCSSADTQTEEKAQDADASPPEGGPLPGQRKQADDGDPNQYLRWVHDHRYRTEGDDGVGAVRRSL